LGGGGEKKKKKKKKYTEFLEKIKFNENHR
jgi:hypothetical protein